MTKQTIQITVFVGLLLLSMTACEGLRQKDDRRNEKDNPISQHPHSVLATNGQTGVMFSVQLSGKFATAQSTSYQWFFNGAPIDAETAKYLGITGQTTKELHISNADTNLVGFYQCAVEHDDSRGRRRIALSEEAELMVSHHSVLTVYGTPVGGAGPGVNCPPQYAGYVIYRLPSSPYGWPFPNGGTATDPNSTNTVVAYFGTPLSNYACGFNGSVSVPANTCAYRFTIYFKRGTQIPNGSYPLILNAR